MDTGDARCQVPSDKLIRDAAAIFVWYDEDKDGLIEQTEWSKIMEKQGMADVTITEPLNLYQFEYYIIAYTLNEQGELDLNKLSVEVQETLEEDKKLLDRLTDLDDYKEINERTIMLMVIGGLLLIIICVSICLCRLRQLNLDLMRAVRREKEYQKAEQVATTQADQNDKEGDILESETSNIGHLVTTEMADQKI